MLDEAFEAPRAVATIMVGFDRPWCIAGGWAIDLELRRVTRAHCDLEIALFRQDQHALCGHLPDCDFFYVRDGKAVKWDLREVLTLPIHEIHAVSTDGWKLEFLLNERDAIDWMYRRDTRIRRSLDKAIRRGDEGIPVLAAEIVLLYKSKSPRPQDELDFRVMHETLDPESRAWLVDALHMTSPEHPWISLLE